MAAHRAVSHCDRTASNILHIWIPHDWQLLSKSHTGMLLLTISHSPAYYIVVTHPVTYLLYDNINIIGAHPGLVSCVCLSLFTPEVSHHTVPGSSHSHLSTAVVLVTRVPFPHVSVVAAYRVGISCASWLQRGLSRHSQGSHSKAPQSVNTPLPFLPFQRACVHHVQKCGRRPCLPPLIPQVAFVMDYEAE